jgi:hypothetical protein
MCGSGRSETLPPKAKCDPSVILMDTAGILMGLPGKVGRRPVADITAFPERCIGLATPNRKSWLFATGSPHPRVIIDSPRRPTPESQDLPVN